VQVSDPGRSRVFLPKPGQQFIQRQDQVGVLGKRIDLIEQIEPNASAAAVEPIPIAGVVDQDTAHGLGSGGEEVRPAVELLVADQAEASLVDEGRGLQRLAGGFGRHPCGGELAQLVVHERQQIGRGPAVAGCGSIEEAGHIGHDGRIYQLFGGVTTKKRRRSGTPATGQLPTAQRCLIPGRAKYIHIGTHGFRCPFAGICPDIGGEEWTAFKWSIRKSGITKAIILDENRSVLDGRQRLRAAAELGLPLDAIPFEVERGLSEDEKLDLYEQMNLLRYHRTPEETARYLDNVRAEMATKTSP
jgi:hypothetical protein